MMAVIASNRTNVPPESRSLDMSIDRRRFQFAALAGLAAPAGLSSAHGDARSSVDRPMAGVDGTEPGFRSLGAADFTNVPYNANAPGCKQWDGEHCLCAHKAEERATSIKAAGTTISTLFVKPASTATNACPGSASCYPPEKFLAERVASPGLDNTADWNDIDQQVGTLADQIVAKIC